MIHTLLLLGSLCATALGTKRRVHPLVGSWDVDVVAASKQESDGTSTPILSKGVFTFRVEGDSLIASLRVALSVSGKPVRLATSLPSDTATFVQESQAVQAQKGEVNRLGTVPMRSIFRFVAAGDSLHGTIERLIDGQPTTTPVAGVRQRAPAR